jgi:heat shock protein HslJ
MLKNINGMVLCFVLALLLGLAGCSSPPPPTCTPVEYFYADYTSNGTSPSTGIQLTRVVWGPYLIRFLGTTSLGGKVVRLKAQLYKDDMPVDWWPEYQFVQLRDNTWTIALNANDYNTPVAFPNPEPGYSLKVFVSNYPQTSTEFPLDFSGSLPENATDNTTPSDLNGSRWILSSINGHRPLPFIRVTLYFDEESFHGSGGCNTYGGRYQTKVPNLFNISLLVMTELGYWWRAVNTQEEALVNALYNVACYRVVDDILELYDIWTNERSLVFKRLK